MHIVDPPVYICLVTTLGSGETTDVFVSAMVQNCPRRLVQIWGLGESARAYQLAIRNIWSL